MIIGFFKNWIISVVSTVIFVIIVDLILPDNSFKKYAKFVTGLIVIVTILSPVFKLFDRNASIETYINQYASTYTDDTRGVDKKDYKENFQRQTIEAFKEKLKASIEEKVRSETGKRIEVVKIEIVEDFDDVNFTEIKYVELKKGYENGEIKPVEKVVVGKDQDNLVGYKDQRVLSVLKKEFNINPDRVKLIK